MDYKSEYAYDHSSPNLVYQSSKSIIMLKSAKYVYFYNPKLAFPFILSRFDFASCS